MNLTPTRRIIKSYRSITGKIPSKKTGRTHRFESTLERDFICLLELDSTVKFYIEQPVRIEYRHDQKNLVYTPDFLVVYQSGCNRLSEIIEVKYRTDLEINYHNYSYKFTAARNYASANGYQFKVVTEDEIRTIDLKNRVFLNGYSGQEIDESNGLTILKTLRELKISTPCELLVTISDTFNTKAELLHTLWQLVSSGRIGCNLNQLITMNSDIWNLPLK